MPQTIDYDALAKQSGAIDSQPPAMDYGALARQAGAVDDSQTSQVMAPGSYQSRKGGPILNANDSAIHTGVRAAQNALGVTKVPTGLWDELSQIAGGAKQFVGNSFNDLQKMTGEESGTPVAGTPYTDALFVPHLVARGIEGLATGIDNSASDITSGIMHRDPRSVASGVGSALGMKGGMEAGERATNAVGEGISNLRGKVSAPLADTMTRPRGTISAEQYTPEDLKAYADANGIPITAAQATENVGLRALQSSGERAVAGGSDVKAGIKASQAAIANHAENLATSMSPNTTDLASQGTAIQQSVQRALDNELNQSNQDYTAVDQAAHGTSVDMGPVKRTAQRVLQGSEILRQIGIDPKTATRVMQGMESVPDSSTFTDAQKVRSALLDLSRSPELAVSNTAQGMIKQLIGATDDAMMQAAQSKPGLEGTFRTANQRWTDIQDDFNSPRSVLNQILKEPDPNRVPHKVIQKGSIAGSPYNPQLFDKYGIDKAPVKAAIVQDLLNRNFGVYGKNLGGYSDNFLNSVFTPDELEHVVKTGALARSAGLNTNPSGTAAVNSAIEQTVNPARLGAQAGAARLTNSPAFNERMMNTTKPPRPSGMTGRIAGSVAAGANQQNSDDETTAAALFQKHGGPAIRQALNYGPTQDILATVAPNTAAFLLKRAGVADKTSFKNRGGRGNR